MENRVNRNAVTGAEIEDFRKCVEESGLMEIRVVGLEFTWHNNQEGEDIIYYNIDRCFANLMWMSDYSNTVVERLEKGVSDHCPQLL